MNCFIVTVMFGCNSKEVNVCQTFTSYKQAVELFARYAERAEAGEWFEELNIQHMPYVLTEE